MNNCSKGFNFKPTFKKQIFKKIITASIIFVVIFTCIFAYLIKKANPIILSYGQSEISKFLSTSCNEAISVASEEFSYGNLIDISFDNQNNISYMVANTSQINKIGHKLTNTIQTMLEEKTAIGLKIPIGTLTGIGILAGKGSFLTFNIYPKGNVLCEFYSKFLSTGINQTNHKIFITIQVSCYLILPFKTEVITKSADFLIAECIIVGKIPNTYLALNANK